MQGPAPPGSEPSSIKPPEAPPVACGSFWSSPMDWYERHKTKKSIFQGDYWKFVGGLSVTYVASLANKITLGWQHKTVVGGTVNFTTPWENKFNGGVVLSWIHGEKNEETVGSKSEWILGCKVSHSNAKKEEFKGTKEVRISLVQNSEATEILQRHIAVIEKALTTRLDEEIKALEAQHAKAEVLMTNYDQEYKKAERTVDTWTQKANAFKGDFKKYREECDSVTAKYSGTFKEIASAAHEINSSASVENTFKAQAKFVAGSLIQIGAAITKAG